VKGGTYSSMVMHVLSIPSQNVSQIYIRGVYTTLFM